MYFTHANYDFYVNAGVKVMFRVGLVLFRIVFGEGGKLSQCPTLYETLEKIRKLPVHQLDEENIVQEVSDWLWESED